MTRPVQEPQPDQAGNEREQSGRAGLPERTLPCAPRISSLAHGRAGRQCDVKLTVSVAVRAGTTFSSSELR